MLLLSLRHIGVSDSEVSWIEVLVVFSFARLADRDSASRPAGSASSRRPYRRHCGYGGDHAQVAAATLVFRALTYVLPIPVGVFHYLF